MYGAGHKKLGSIAGRSTSAGKKFKENFYKKYPAILALVNDLEKSCKVHGGYIKTLDGRKVFIRSEHKLLNTLIQSAAAIIFKVWMIKVDELITEYGLPAKQVIAMHDELQFEYRGETPDLLAGLVVGVAKKVGEDLKIKVPILAKATVGKNWKETH